MSTLASGTYPRATAYPFSLNALLRAVRRSGARVWSAMAAFGQRRARAHLLQLAEQYETINPGLAADLRAAALARTA